MPNEDSKQQHLTHYSAPIDLPLNFVQATRQNKPLNLIESSNKWKNQWNGGQGPKTIKKDQEKESKIIEKQSTD